MQCVGESGEQVQQGSSSSDVSSHFVLSGVLLRLLLLRHVSSLPLSNPVSAQGSGAAAICATSASSLAHPLTWESGERGLEVEPRPTGHWPFFVFSC